MKIASIPFAVALGCCGLFVTPSSAAPLRYTEAPTVSTAVDQVHWRRFRHCHQRWGDRRCHGPRFYRGYGPGVNLYIGPGRRWGHRHGRWGRHW